MKKFWKLVNKRYLVFGALLFAVVIVLGLIEAANMVKITFTDEAVTAKARTFTMKITYDIIESVEMVEMPDAGTTESGQDILTLRTGVWNNQTWGEHTVCLVPTSTQCIVVHLTDGRIFVFNGVNNEKTSAAYETLLTYLPTQ